ncbi:unnamed protein product [Pieris macdunnoughi]|uniref:Uncharacterized protein n=1 Tax=Pieris macdunnoughi TaxID=345717 RepID=A0A821U557_9NEOP|nr:unnamed protein product [Pieris macdunnoughi]
MSLVVLIVQSFNLQSGKRSGPLSARRGALCNPVNAPLLHVRTKPARSFVGGFPLKIARRPEQTPGRHRQCPSVSLLTPFHPRTHRSAVTLTQTAEYQNKEARRAVAAPARRPAGLADMPVLV